MVGIQIKVTGLKEFIAKNELTIKKLEKGAFTHAMGKKIKRRAKYRAPRKSGKLVRQIDYKVTSYTELTLTCDAVNKDGVAYPAILEFGLSRFIPIGNPESPRIITSGNNKTAFLPFMRWALWRTLKEKDRILKKTIINHYK